MNQNDSCFHLVVPPSEIEDTSASLAYHNACFGSRIGSRKLLIYFNFYTVHFRKLISGDGHYGAVFVLVQIIRGMIPICCFLKIFWGIFFALRFSRGDTH